MTEQERAKITYES